MKPKRWSRWLGAAFGLSLLAALWAAADASLHGQPLPALPLAAWVLVPAALLMSHTFRAARIHAELSAHAPVAFADCLRIGVLHSAAVNLVPMRGGEFAYPWLVHRRLRIDTHAALASLVRMRVQDAVVLGHAAILLWPVGPFALRLALAFACALVVAAGLRHWRQRPVPVTGWMPQLRIALWGTSGASASGWVYSAGSWCTKLLAIAAQLCLLTPMPAGASLRGALGGELAALWPLQAPAGVGTYEAGVWLGSTFLTLEAPSAGLVVAAVLTHLVVWLTTATAAVVAGWSWGFSFASPLRRSDGQT